MSRRSVVRGRAPERGGRPATRACVPPEGMVRSRASIPPPCIQDRGLPMTSAPTRNSSTTGHFIRHYVEMVVAMFLGMAVLGLPAGWAMGALGTSWSELSDNAPALMLLAMASTMTVPMVGWMMYRGHGWRANAEMSASMFLPTFAVIGLLAADVQTDLGVLLIIE